MGCGVSKPAVKDDDRPHQRIPAAEALVQPRKSLGEKKEKAAPENSSLHRMSLRDIVATSSTSPQQNSDEEVQNRIPSASLRQPLTSLGGSASMARTSHQAWQVQQGWKAGKSVIYRDDYRTAQIINLACAITKVPWVILVTREHGRYAVTGSPLFSNLNIKLWLPEFCHWLYHFSGDGQFLIEAADMDKRCSGQTWVYGDPHIKFICAMRLIPSEGTETPGFLCALHTENVPNASTFSILLKDLANMATRELDGSSYGKMRRAELFTEGHRVPPFMRYRLDTSSWPMILIDVNPPNWTILFGGWSVWTFLGVHPGYLEGHDFWKFFDPLKQEGEDFKEQYKPSLSEGQTFHIPALVFKRPRGQVQTSKILTKAEFGKLSSQSSKHFDVESAWSDSLWIVSLQPEAAETLEERDRISYDQPFPAVEIGPVIGKGSFGYVCKGMLGSTMVAVKIIEAAMIFKMDSEGQPLEASLAIKLRHPNIVLMLDYDTNIKKGLGSCLEGSQKGSAGSLESLAEEEEQTFQNGSIPRDNADHMIGENVDPNRFNSLDFRNDGQTHTSKKLDKFLKDRNVDFVDTQEIQQSSQIQPSGFAAPQVQKFGMFDSAQEKGSGCSALSIDRRRSLKAALSSAQLDGVVEAWLLLEYCDQGSLLDAIESGRFHSFKNSKKEVELDAVLSTAYEIASAMRYLHSLNILHGDLTAGNVLLCSSSPVSDDPRGFVAKVGDFGLSRQALNSAVATQNIGTVTHMPPEVLCEGLISKAADVYAFGVLLVEMFCGERAFSGKRHPQILHLVAILKKHPELPETAPPFLIELVNSCMREDPKDRVTFEKIVNMLRPYQKYIIYGSPKN